MRSSARNELSSRVLSDGYRLLWPIGKGGSSIVYEAERLSDQARVAIKMLASEHATHPDLCARLTREAMIGSSLSAAFVARTLGVGHLEDGSPYVVMQKLEGESLSRLLLRVGRLPWYEAFALGARIARILQAVHAARFVHRDLKPDHVWLDRCTEGGIEVKLIDFGVAQTPEASQSARNYVYGTPGYLAPEQAALSGPVDGRADLYALGIVLFEMITGERPFVGANAAVLMRRALEEDVPVLRRSRAPEAASLVVTKLCARDIALRFASARVAERALNRGIDMGQADRQLAARLMRTERSEGAHLPVDTSVPTRNAALM